jgi:hypothetical protein
MQPKLVDETYILLETMLGLGSNKVQNFDDLFRREAESLGIQYVADELELPEPEEAFPRVECNPSGEQTIEHSL